MGKAKRRVQMGVAKRHRQKNPTWGKNKLKLVLDDSSLRFWEKDSTDVDLSLKEYMKGLTKKCSLFYYFEVNLERTNLPKEMFADGFPVLLRGMAHPMLKNGGKRLNSECFWQIEAPNEDKKKYLASVLSTQVCDFCSMRAAEQMSKASVLYVEG